MTYLLAANDYGYLWKTSLEEDLDRLLAMGFRRLELLCSPPHVQASALSAADRAALLRRVESGGAAFLSVTAPSLDLNLASMHPDMREYSVQEWERLLDLCADLGARYAVCIAGKRHTLIEQPFETIFGYARQSFERLIRRAEQRGVVLALENAPLGFLDTAERCLRLLTDLRHPSFQICYDVANGFMVEDPSDGLTTVRDFLGLVHLSDARKDRWLHAPIGTQEIDFAAVTRTLELIGYRGAGVAEIIDDDPDAGIRLSKERLAPLGWTVDVQGAA
jgi:deoxyribonuclease-4